MKRVRLDAPHGRSSTEILAALDVSLLAGLSDQEAEQRLSVYGANTIGSRQRAGLISILFHQLRSLVVGLLAVAATVAFYFREWEEGGAIVGVLILNIGIGFVTEIKAVRSIAPAICIGSSCFLLPDDPSPDTSAVTTTLETRSPLAASKTAATI